MNCDVAFEVHGHENVVDCVAELGLTVELLKVELAALGFAVEVLEAELTVLELAALELVVELTVESEMEELIVVGDAVKVESLTACLLVPAPLRKK